MTEQVSTQLMATGSTLPTSVECRKFYLPYPSVTESLLPAIYKATSGGASGVYALVSDSLACPVPFSLVISVSSFFYFSETEKEKDWE